MQIYQGKTVEGQPLLYSVPQSPCKTLFHINLVTFPAFCNLLMEPEKYQLMKSVFCTDMTLPYI